MSASNDQYTGSNMRTLDKRRRCEKKKGVESKKRLNVTKVDELLLFLLCNTILVHVLCIIEVNNVSDL